MTTNAIDRVNAVVASDSRWSKEIGPNLLAFVDNTGFDKLANRASASMLFAGDGVLIQQWKRWFRAEKLDYMLLPPVHRNEGGRAVNLSISIVEKPSCKVLFDWGGWLLHGDQASFSGSGAAFARDCYGVNGCGKTAIGTACLHDPATGGETKFVELSTGAHNLSMYECTLEEATQQINEKGFVMDTTTNVITPIREFQQMPGNALQALGDDRSLSAPTGLPSRCWTDAEQHSLRSALEALAHHEEATQA